MMWKIRRRSAFSDQPSAISIQLSAFSDQSAAAIF